MSLLTVFYDDILTYIISYLDNESCVSTAHTCWYLYRLIHRIRPTMLLTNNIFEALRSGLLLSFKHALPGYSFYGITCMRDVSTPILRHLYINVGMDVAQYNLWKRGIRTRYVVGLRCDKLVVHAIKYGKKDLLAKLSRRCSRAEFERYCSYGYAKIGDYDALVRITFGIDDVFKYYAQIGGNRDIIALTDHVIDDISSKSRKMYINYAIRHNNVVMFNTYYHDYGVVTRMHLLRMAIHYDAIDIVSNTSLIDNIVDWSHGSTPYDMTMRMAITLLEKLNNSDSIIKYIISACNHRLTEMLRVRGLHNVVHTRMDCHITYNTLSLQIPSLHSLIIKT